MIKIENIHTEIFQKNILILGINLLGLIVSTRLMKIAVEQLRYTGEINYIVITCSVIFLMTVISLIQTFTILGILASPETEICEKKKKNTMTPKIPENRR